jgi:hypothetical protein
MKIRGDKPVEVVIYIYMEISQGNSLCSYLYVKQAKNVMFFILSLFFCTKSEGRTGSMGRGEVLTAVGRGRWQGKGVGG